MTHLSVALAELERDIADARDALQELEKMRAAILPFVARYVGEGLEPALPLASSHLPKSSTRNPEGATEAVLGMFEARLGEVLGISEVMASLRIGGHDFKRETVRNSLHYLVRKGKLGRGSRRGTFVFVPVHGSAATDSTAAADASMQIGGDLSPHLQGDGDRPS